MLAPICFSVSEYQSKILSDGSYDLAYTYNGLVDKSEIVIKKGLFEEYNKAEKIRKGKIRWISQNLFVMDYINSPKIDTTQLSKRLLSAFGETCIEIDSVRNDTLFFKTRHANNLHILINKGILIKRTHNFN
jgi:hypothetical protein